MAKKKESLMVASNVKAFVSEIDRGMTTAQRDIQTLGQRFPGDDRQVQRTAWLGLQDLAHAHRALQHVRGAVDSLGQYLESVQSR